MRIFFRWPSLLLLSLFFAFFTFLAPQSRAKDLSPGEVHLILAEAGKNPNLSVLEGLPHQMFEKQSYLKQLQRKDITKIAKYPFYAEKSAPKQDKALRTFLQSKTIAAPFTGEKACGGFHPDYALVWTDEQDKTHAALICSGCGELLYVPHSGSPQRFDLAKNAKTTFSVLLQAHRKNRPEEP